MPEANWQNRTLFHGDNLEFLRGMNTGTVHLIATDPPFNKGRDFHATPDSLAAGARFQDRWSWDDDVHPEWVDQITDDWPHVMEVINGSRASYGDDMGAFLCFMAVRLLEMRRVLRDDGSIYLHCDPTASHYLKELMDAVFGKRNFRNEIIWSYRRWPSKHQNFQRMHDVILRYSKSDDVRWNQLFEPPSESFTKRFRGKANVLDPGATKKRPAEHETPGLPMRDVWDISILAGSSKGAPWLPNAEAPCPLRTHRHDQQRRRRLGARPLRGLRHHLHRRRATGAPMGWHGHLGQGP